MAENTMKITTLEQLKTALLAAKAYIDGEIDGLGSLAGKSEVAYDDLAAALKKLIDDKADGSVVTTLVGSDTNKSVRSISAEEVAKIVAGADTKFDTLKEIADWILSDTTGAAKMANDIDHLDAVLAGIGGEGEQATVVAYVASMIEALGIGDYVTNAVFEEEMAKKVDKVEGSRLMTNAEGTKLAGISDGAKKVEASTTNGNVKIDGVETVVYTHPDQAAVAAAFVKIGNDGKGHVVVGDAITKSDITALGIPAQDTTYDPATQSANGLMSSTDKAKLDGITAALDTEVSAICTEVFGA